VARSLGEDEEEFLAKQFPEDTPDEPPTALEWQWYTFCRISKRRQYGFNGPQPISYMELQSYERFMGFQFHPWEVDLLTDLDDLWMEECYGRLSRTTS